MRRIIIHVQCFGWFILLFKVSCVHSYFCETGKDCPSNLPFCTPAGCVFECPESTFLNGTSCVIHCGKEFILNNTCLPSCPRSHNMIQEKVGIVSSQFQRLKFCISVCPSHTFEFNGNCVQSCPDGNKFIEKGQCVSKCSTPINVFRNITLGNRFLGTECLSKCNRSSLFPFRQNRICVSMCDKEQVVSSGNCQPSCPANRQIQLNKKTCMQVEMCMAHWPEQVYCSESCPDGYFSFNKTCVHNCPEVALYVFNGTCVKMCPSSHPYHHDNHNMYRYNTFLECTDVCPNQLKTDLVTLECVWNCRKGTKSINETCVMDCPQNMFIHKSYNTDELTCVSNCPVFVQNDTCVNACPRYSVNKACVDICPNKYNLIYKNSCELKCPNNTCLAPNGKNCSDDCSLNPTDKTIAYRCPKHTPYRRKNICVTTCNDSEVIDEMHCINVTDCKKEVLSHKLCLNECPEGYLYLAQNSRYTTDDEYSYTMKDINYNPCQKAGAAYLQTTLFGICVSLYGVWMAFFISTKQFHFLKRGCFSIGRLFYRLSRRKRTSRLQQVDSIEEQEPFAEAIT